MKAYNNYSSFLLAAIFLILSFTGCVTPTESLLQRVDLEGIPLRHTIKITQQREAGNINLRGNLSFNNNDMMETRSDKHTLVNSDGIFQVEPVTGEDYFLEREGINKHEFEGNNIYWHMPDVQGRFEIDIAATDHFAFVAGLNYASINNKNFLGESIGIAFFGEKDSWGYRFDANVNFYDMELKAEYAVIEQTDFPKKVLFIEEKISDKWKDLNFGFTLNSSKRDWLINVFFNYTLGWQTLYNFESEAIKGYQPSIPFLYPTEVHDDFKFFESYNSISGGLYKNVFDVGRIVFGARYTYFTNNHGGLTTPDFFLQYEFNF